jgi:hypothetical protein
MSTETVDTKKTEQKEVVPKEAYENVMSDLQKTKQNFKELQDRLKSFEDEKESLKVKGLKDKEEWQKLAEIREREAQELKQKLEATSKSTANYFKRAEVRQQALKAGIREAALDDIDLLPLDDVAVETTSHGRLNVLGADKFVDRLRATKPHWFESKADPGVVSTTPSTQKASPVDAKSVAKLFREGKMAEYNEAMAKMLKKKR